MPSGKGPLRVAIEDFLETNPLSAWLLKWWGGVQERREKLRQLEAEKVDPAPKLVRLYFYLSTSLTVIVWVVTGLGNVDKVLEAMSRPEELSTSEVVARTLRLAFGDPAVKEIAETFGAFVTEPVLSIFEQYAGDDTRDPKEFARAFHGFMASLTAAGGLVDTALEAATAGQIEGGGRMLMGMYWSLGLGFLGWQTLAPLLESGLQPGLNRYYAKLYRPKRFSAGEVRDLYALGELSQDQLQEELRFLGWREHDIGLWLKLSFRNLNEGDVWALYHKGELTEADTVRRLRALGYDPDDIPLLFVINQKEDVSEAESVSLATAKAAYREQLLSESEFRSILEALKKSPREIDLLVMLAKQQIESDLRRLTVGQVHDAWEENVLSDAEVTHWLGQEGFEQTEVDLLLRTWKAQVEPPFRKLNKGTVVEAYIAAVLTREQAYGKLTDIGLSPEDARLELDLAEARAPELFGKPQRAGTKQLTPGVLEELLAADLITASIMEEELVSLGFTAADASLLTQLAVQKAAGEPRPLSQITVERAYIAGVLTRQQAHDKLIELDFPEENVENILRTVEQENPAVFAPETVQAIRLPSTSALQEAVRAGIITEAEFFARMAELGFTANVARMYLTLATRQERKGSKQLTVSQIANAYQRDFFDRATSLTRLVNLGYSDADAQIILRFEKSGIEETDVWKAMVAGLLDPVDAYAQLLSMGFTPGEIEKALAELGAGG